MTMSMCNIASDAYFICNKVNEAESKPRIDEGKTICWSEYNQILSYSQDRCDMSEEEKRSCWYQVRGRVVLSYLKIDLRSTEKCCY